MEGGDPGFQEPQCRSLVQHCSVPCASVGNQGAREATQICSFRMNSMVKQDFWRTRKELSLMPILLGRMKGKYECHSKTHLEVFNEFVKYPAVRRQ